MATDLRHLPAPRQRGEASDAKAVLFGLALLLGLLGGAAPAAARVLRVEPGDGDAIALAARDVPIVEALEALSAEGGFAVDVAGADGRRRPPANLTVPMAPLETVLRELLRGRNYAIVYDQTGAATQVILLAPSDPRRVGRPAPRKRPAPGKRAPRHQGPVVVVR